MVRLGSDFYGRIQHLGLFQSCGSICCSTYFYQYGIKSGNYLFVLSSLNWSACVKLWPIYIPLTLYLDLFIKKSFPKLLFIELFCPIQYVTINLLVVYVYWKFYCIYKFSYCIVQMSYYSNRFLVKISLRKVFAMCAVNKLYCLHGLHGWFIHGAFAMNFVVVMILSWCTLCQQCVGWLSD